MLILGTALAIPASLLAALAPSIEVLFVARLLGGLAAGHGLPDDARADHGAVVGPGAHEVDRAVVRPRRRDRRARARCSSGALLTGFDWGSVFLITLPLAVVALVLAFRLVPAHVNEATDPVDNLGGILSVLLVAALVLAINFAPVPNEGALAVGLGVVALAAGVAFVLRQRRARSPLYDLDVAGRRIFWVAACAGIIVFGTLMGAMFVGQQFLQNVLGYSTLDAGLAILPGGRVHGGGRAALGEAGRGPRRPVHAARRLRVLPARLPRDAPALEGGHLLLEGRARLRADRHRRRASPARRPRTRSPGSVPVRARGHGVGHGRPPARPGRGDHAVDPRRRCSPPATRAAVGAAIAASPGQRQGHDQVQARADEVVLERGRHRRSSYPEYQNQIVAAAKASFLQGDDWAYMAGIVAIVLGAVLVFFLFPKQEQEAGAARAVPRGGRLGGRRVAGV